MIDLFRKKQKSILPKATTLDQSRDTGMAMVLLSLLFSYFFTSKISLLVAIVLLILNMTVPMVFGPLAKIWIGLSVIIGNIVSRILLSIIYFLLVTPVGLIRKLFGDDPMQLKKWKKGNGPIFRERNQLLQSKDIEKPY